MAFLFEKFTKYLCNCNYCYSKVILFLFDFKNNTILFCLIQLPQSRILFCLKT